MKNTYKLIVMVAMLLFSMELSAQENLAANTNATFTASGGNALYGITRMNNGQINSCGFQDCWIPGQGGSTAEWFLCTFNQAEDVNTIRIWVAEKDTRYLAGATIQVWNGSSYVDHYTYSVPYDDANRQSNRCDYTIRFPRVNTERIRITKWVVEGNQKSNPDFREMEVYNLKGDDVGVVDILPQFAAGNQPVEIIVRNISNDSIHNFNVGWSINGTSQTGTAVTTYAGMLPADSFFIFKDTLLNLGSFNFISNTQYTIKAWTSLPNGVADSVLTNDTSTLVFTAVGKPNTPVLQDQTYCGTTMPTLIGSGDPGTTLNWFSDAATTQFLGTGDTVQLTTPYYAADTVLFYARSAQTLDFEHTLASMGGIWSFAGGASPQDKGVYLNIMPKYNILLDSLDIGFTAPNTTTAGPHDVDVFWRQGVHNGSETNAGAWTFAATSSVTLNVTPLYNNRITPVRVSAGRVILSANTQYSLYIRINNVNAAVRTNAGAGSIEQNQTRFENETFIMEEGALSAGNFAATGLAGGYVPHVHFFYEMLLESDSGIAEIKLHPKPTGAEIAGKSGSLGTFRAGTQSDFDYTTNGEMMEYVLTPPDGYTNADFGTTWAITDFRMETESGTGVDPMDTTTTSPGVGGAGELTFNPQVFEVDSLYKITMVIADLGPYNCDSVLERWVYVAPRPHANFTFPATACDGDGILFENQSTIESGFMTHQWYFIDNNTNTIIDSSDGINPVITFPTYGEYRVRLISTNAQYGYSDDTTIIVTVGEIPTIDIKAINACEGVPVQFKNNTTASTAVPTFMWDFGDGSGTSMVKEPSYLYATAGGYQVKLTATAAGCSSEKTINAYQFAKPATDFTSPTGLLCSDEELDFTNNTTIAIGAAGALWDFNDNGVISTELNPKHAFSTGGSFDVKLISVSEFGCQDSATKTVNVNLAPKASFNQDQYCEKEPTQFVNTSTDMGSNPGIVWDFGDNGASSTLPNPSHNWTQIGPFTVKLTVTSDNGCVSSAEKKVEVLPQPIADFTVNDACSGEEVSFENLSSVSKGKLDYLWQLGGGNGTSTAGSPKATYNVSTSTSYNVTLTATVAGGCPAEVTKPINIEPSPTCGFTAVDTFISPQGRGMYFRANAQSGATYKWVLGVDGAGPNQSEFFHQFTYFRPYDVSLTVENASDCKCNSTQTVQFPPTSVVNISEVNVNIYPSPATDIVTIDGTDQKISVQIFDAEGKLVYAQTGFNKEVIDISKWAAGIYQIQVQTVQGTATTKLVKL